MAMDISWDTAQIRRVCQAVFDALRAFLILENKPLAGKKEAVDYFIGRYDGFEELEAIFLSYTDPASVANVADLVLDAHAMVRHLFYRASAREYSDRVVLINTPSSVLPHPRDDYLSRDPNMPLGLVCLCSYCRERGQSVSILDAYAENLGALSVIDRLFEGVSDLPKVIAMNCSSPNIHIAHAIAKYAKRIAPDMTVVCGGPHASLAPEHTLGTGNVDYVVVGEGESPFANLVDLVFRGHREDVPDVPGIATMLGKSLVVQENPEVLDMAELPLPAFDALPLDRYFTARRRIYLHATRGCSYACIFCSVPKCWPGAVRVMPMAQLVTQIVDCQSRYSATEFQIVDDNFSHRGGLIIRDFIANLKKAGVRIRWKCQARADQLDGELIDMMAESGCFEIDLGIESGSSRIQAYIRKNLDLDATRAVVERVHRNGIFSKAFFMTGFPDESYEEIGETINYSIQLKQAGLDDVAFFPVMPFPGTEIAERAGRSVLQGAVIDEVDVFDTTWEGVRLRKYCAKPEISLNPRFTPDQLRLLVRFAYQMFDLGQPIANLEAQFKTYIAFEQDGVHGSSALSSAV